MVFVIFFWTPISVSTLNSKECRRRNRAVGKLSSILAVIDCEILISFI